MTKQEANQYIKTSEVYAIVKRLEARIDNLQNAIKEIETIKVSSDSESITLVDLDVLFSKYFN